MKNNTMSAFIKLFTNDIPVKAKCLECTQLDVSCSGIPTTSSTEACPDEVSGGEELILLIALGVAWTVSF